jgi:dihydroorotate dehydrogenase
MMYKFLRPLLFRLEPETSHRLTLQLLRMAGNFPLSNWFLTQLYRAESKPVQAFGLTFKNPLGLAAGYDKDALAIKGLAALGFGHIEIGTVTPKPQAGNPRPRVFRLIEDEAVLNRMGFPSLGMEIVSRRLLRFVRNDIILGVNLGKNKDTPLEEAAQDYITLMRRLMFHADYLTINISSPNTVGLRRLQGRDMLEGLLATIADARVGADGRPPLRVKI